MAADNMDVVGVAAVITAVAVVILAVLFNSLALYSDNRTEEGCFQRCTLLHCTVLKLGEP